MKTIFHIDNNDKWPVVFGNVKNLIKEYNDNNYDIIVLANSKAVLNYLNNDIIENVLSLSNSNVTFKACNNALNNLKVDKDKLNSKIEVVPAGVFELTLKQKEGYSYIKV